MLNETHDPTIKSWVRSANDSGTDFPIQNLPFGVFRRKGSKDAPRICVAIGNYTLDVGACDEKGLFSDISPELSDACRSDSLNQLMGLSQPHCSLLRRKLWNLLRADTHDRPPTRDSVEKFLVPISAVELLMPATIGDYSDFYGSFYHARNVGGLFRPENPLLPNYKYVPVGYHGRASSIVASGTPVRRPCGQTRPKPSDPVGFGPSSRLDYEMEIGCFVGAGNEQGAPIPLASAEDHIFGFCIVNDWSARDIQSWEGQPLGPFLAKNFATTVSSWVVTLEALAPFRVPAFSRPDGDPDPLPHLFSSEDRSHGGIDIAVEVFIRSERMRQQGCPAMRLSHGNLRDMYWTPAQMLTHHASNGCNLRPGDLLATGTISGPAKDSSGCLLELTRGGAEPLQLPTGETRLFLEDGDEIIMRASCESPRAVPIGFGSCSGIVQPVAP